MKIFSKSKTAKVKRIFKILLSCFVFVMLGVYILFLFSPLFGINYYIVETDSMKPTINEGEMVLVKQTKMVKVGDIVTFIQPLLGTITHRLVAIVEDDGEIYYICCGDNNLDMPWQEVVENLKKSTAEECFSVADNVVVKENIIGVVKYKLNKIGKIFKYLENNKLLILATLILIILILKYNDNYLKEKDILKYLKN